LLLQQVSTCNHW